MHAPFLLLQGEQKDNRARLLLECCAILFASSQMKRLSLSMKHELGDVYLPNKLILLISVASSLVRLTLVIPELRNFKALAETIRSLQKLKVGANTTLRCRVSLGYGWPALTPQAVPPIVSRFGAVGHMATLPAWSLRRSLIWHTCTSMRLGQPVLSKTRYMQQSPLSLRFVAARCCKP